MRKRLVLDLALSISIGTVCAYAYWNIHSVPKLEKYRDYFAKEKKEYLETHAEFLNSLKEASQNEWFFVSLFSFDKGVRLIL